MKYQSKLVTKEAEQFKFPYEADLATQQAYCDRLGVKIEYDAAHAEAKGIALVKFSIETLEGPHVVQDNDFIITGLQGEKYPCKPDIFELSYELVKESTHEPKLAREFPYLRPRRWKQEKSGKFFKVLPWFQPFDNDSRIDFKGLFKDLVPELKLEDAMGDMEIYSGLSMHVGYQILNDGGLWFCIGHSAKKFFEDAGEWDDSIHGENIPTFPLTKEGEERSKKDKAERKAAKKKAKRGTD